MRLYEILAICNDNDSLIDFLIEKGVFKEEIECIKCKSKVRLNHSFTNFYYHCSTTYYKQVKHKKRRRCVCNFKISALTGTWFAKSKLPIPTACRLVGYFLMIRAPRQIFLEKKLGLSSHTAVDWTNFCREICYLHYIHFIYRKYFDIQMECND